MITYLEKTMKKTFKEIMAEVEENNTSATSNTIQTFAFTKWSEKTKGSDKGYDKSDRRNNKVI